MAVTMRDVAARAGVSPVVVSRVLHNKALTIRVSEATAERVRVAAADLGYRCNIWARNFRNQQTFTIGVLHGVGFPRPSLSIRSRYFATLMDGVVQGAFDHGYSITLCPQLLGSNPDSGMSDGRFDGLVWYSTDQSTETRKMLNDCTVPLVVIHSRACDFSDKFPTVIVDNDMGLSLAVQHLLDLGHTRIAFAFEGHAPTNEAYSRLEAFKNQMSLRGLATTERDIIDIRDKPADINRFLTSLDHHTALIACHDGLASEFLQAAPNHNVRIPERLSVVGFDSTAYCDEQVPRLTSINQPLFGMGEMAIKLLIQSISGNRPDPIETVFPCSLDIRESTCSPR